MDCISHIELLLEQNVNGKQWKTILYGSKRARKNIIYSVPIKLIHTVLSLSLSIFIMDITFYLAFHVAKNKIQCQISILTFIKFFNLMYQY